ncbi:MAG: hypothetical protein AAF960_29540 [Bacteroidota bacterium]
MKHFTKNLIGILCLLVSSWEISAQPMDAFVFQPSNLTASTSAKQQYTHRSKTPFFYRHHKRLELTHSGIVLELIVSERPLERSHPIFRQFGNVHYDRLDEGGYAYCVLTNFGDVKKANEFLRQMILRRAPEARVVRYKLGKRKQIVQ